LELILNLLQNCGVNFKTNEKFIYAIRNYLCVSLLNNCTSQLAQITGLSLQIFLLLIDNFKQHLKSEVEVFLSTIFIRILESENSTYDHKLRVLEVFQSICKDPVSQAELFVNYDCDFDASNIFSRMVSASAKIAKVAMCIFNIFFINKMFIDRIQLFRTFHDYLLTLWHQAQRNCNLRT